jgi:cholesterol 7-dehydrogenase
MMLDNSERIARLANRGQTIHDIMCHIQDIPENGADIFHFKYIHKYLISRYKILEVSWAPKWKRGDDPTLAELF